MRNRFCKHKVFDGITKATKVEHLTLKKAHIDGSIFFQIPYCWFISEYFWASLTKPTKTSRDIGNSLFKGTMGMSVMPDHTQGKLHDQTATSIDILLHAKSKLSTLNTFWGRKNWKNMQFDWSRLFSTTTQNPDFFQPCGFYRFQKMVYHLKLNLVLIDQIFFQNLCCRFISGYLGHAWLNPNEITWSNCNFYENLTTFKKGILYFK